MPPVTEEQLDAAISAGEIGAVTLDTSIFDQFDCNLRYKILRSLDQFKGTQVAVVFSDVIAGEVRAHIRRYAETETAKLRATLNHYCKAWHRREDVAVLAAGVDLERDATAFGQNEWDAFVQAVGAQIIASDGRVCIAELLRRHFAKAPPFSDQEAKKREFPDALALLSLEAWAEDHNTQVLAISRDGDWQAYAAASARVVCIATLQKALDHFNQAAHFVADRIVAKLRENSASDLRYKIELSIQAYLNDLDFEVEAHSDFYYDTEPLSAVLQHWEIAEGPLVVESNTEQVTFSLELDCTINFKAEFKLSLYDGVDKDWVNAGSTTAEVEETPVLSLTITCTRDLDPEPAVVDVEVTKEGFYVDFDYVHPNWGYEE